MGVKHVIEIELLLKEKPNEWFSKAYLQDRLGCNHYTMKEALIYLLERDMIDMRTKGKSARYRWRQENGKTSTNDGRHTKT